MLLFNMVLLSNSSTFRTTIMVMKSFHEICGGPFCGSVGSCPCPDAALIIRTKNYYNLMIFLHVTINNVRDLLGTQCIILRHRPTSQLPPLLFFAARKLEHIITNRLKKRRPTCFFAYKRVITKCQLCVTWNFNTCNQKVIYYSFFFIASLLKIISVTVILRTSDSASLFVHLTC